MGFVLRCALGAVAVAGVTLVAACQSIPSSAPPPRPAPTSITTTVPTSTSSAPVSTPTAVVSQPGLSAAQIYLVGKDGPKAIEPKEIFLSGDSTLYVENATWTSWTTADAAGSGVMVLNDCVPYCAAGHLLRYPVTIHLDQPQQTSCGQIWGGNVFTFTGSVPSLDLTPPVVHRNGHAEMDLTPDLSRC
jgi:hypothetical protein